jgi:hypothetical protein
MWNAIKFTHRGSAVPTILTERLLIKVINKNKEFEK